MQTVSGNFAYAGFWLRLGAMLVDFLVWVPLTLVLLWGELEYRLFDVYALAPLVLVSLAYHVWLVARFGGTPGKLWLGLRIARIDGTPIGLRRALVRHLPELLLWATSAAALCVPLLAMSDEHYAELLPHLARRHKELEALAPRVVSTDPSALCRMGLWRTHCLADKQKATSAA